MAKHTSDTETIILINQDDKKAGFFQFGSSNPTHWRILERRIGTSRVLSCVESRKGGKVLWKQFKVPYKYLASTLGLKKIVRSPNSHRGRGFGARKGI